MTNRNEPGARTVASVLDAAVGGARYPTVDDIVRSELVPKYIVALLHVGEFKATVQAAAELIAPTVNATDDPDEQNRLGNELVDIALDTIVDRATRLANKTIARLKEERNK